MRANDFRTRFVRSRKNAQTASLRPGRDGNTVLLAATRIDPPNDHDAVICEKGGAKSCALGFAEKAPKRYSGDESPHIGRPAISRTGHSARTDKMVLPVKPDTSIWLKGFLALLETRKRLGMTDAQRTEFVGKSDRGSRKVRGRGEGSHRRADRDPSGLGFDHAVVIDANDRYARSSISEPQRLVATCDGKSGGSRQCVRAGRSASPSNRAAHHWQP